VVEKGHPPVFAWQQKPEPDRPPIHLMRCGQPYYDPPHVPGDGAESGQRVRRFLCNVRHLQTLQDMRRNAGLDAILSALLN